MIKVWADVAWNDYCNFFELHQQKLIKMVHELIKDIERNGVDEPTEKVPQMNKFTNTTRIIRI